MQIEPNVAAMSSPVDFFISYNHKDVRWAEWIAWQLEDAKYGVRVQAWDFRPGSNFVLEMQKAATDAKHTIAVLSANYLESFFVQPEWATAFANDPTGTLQKLILVRVEQCEPTGLLAPLVQIRVDGLDEASALTRLLEGVKEGRAKPKNPPEFPGPDGFKKLSSTKPLFPADFPRVWNVPYLPNPFFIGRGDLLAKLGNTLKSGIAAAITQPAAIHGLGGVGKTQLAAQYAWVNRSDYDFVLWVNSETSASVLSNFSELCSPNLLNLPGTAEDKQEIRSQAVTTWLRTNRRWLIIFDTADSRDSIETIRKLLPPVMHGHVIITSRLSDWSVGFEPLVVDTLPEPDAIQFLIQRTSKTGSDLGGQDEAAQIANKLGCLPLALEQAAAYIIRHRVTFSHYHDLLDKALDKLMEFRSEGGTNYQRTVSTTWLVTTQCLSWEAKAILNLASFFSPEGIPRKMFSSNGDVIADAVEISKNGETASEVAPLPEQSISSALVELADYSLIDLQPEEINCHRLLQTVVLNDLASKKREELNAAALAIATDFSPQKPDEDGQLSARLFFPHAQRVLNYADQNKCEHLTSVLWFWCGMFLNAEGNYPASLTALETALKRFVVTDEQSSRFQLSIKTHLACALIDMSRISEAEIIAREVVKGMEEFDGPDHPENAGHYANLGACLARQGKVEEAEFFIKKGLELEEKTHGALSWELAATLGTLAKTAEVAGRYRESEDLTRRALVLASKTERKPQLRFNLLGNLGLLCHRLRRYDEAKPYLQEALTFCEEKIGKVHPSYSRALNNLGLLLHDMGKYEEAEPMFLRSLEICEKIFGKVNPEIAIALNNYGRLLTETGRSKEAENVFKRAIDIYSECFGPEYRSIGTVFTNMGFCFVNQKSYPEAEIAFRKGLEIEEKAYGNEHFEVAANMGNLGFFLAQQGKFAQADPLLRRFVKIYEKILGKDHQISRHARESFKKFDAMRQLYGKAYKP